MAGSPGGGAARIVPVVYRGFTYLGGFRFSQSSECPPELNSYPFILSSKNIYENLLTSFHVINAISMQRRIHSQNGQSL